MITMEEVVQVILTLIREREEIRQEASKKIIELEGKIAELKKPVREPDNENN